MKKFSLGFTAFLQATALLLYCSLIGMLMVKGNEIFGKPASFLGPLTFLTLFVTSAVICALIYFGVAAVLFWEKRQVSSAIRLIALTTSWSLFYLISLLIYSAYLR